MKFIVLMVAAALIVSAAMAFLTVWMLRVFGMDIDYSWQSLTAVWITLAVVNGIAMRVKEH